MNNKVFGTINAATWATGNEIGHQFSVLNSISNGKERGVVDVCNLCKTGEERLSPDSVITVQDGCRCKAQEAPEITTNGTIMDIADIGKDEPNTGVEQQMEVIEEIKAEQQPEENGDYAEQSAEVKALTPEPNKYISENDTPVQQLDTNNDETVNNDEPISDETSNDENTSDETSNESGEVDIIIKDDGALEKFCTGQMNTIEYAINITIIILFIAISVMAILMIFKLACCKCCACGVSCGKLCPRCGKCSHCCECHTTQKQYTPTSAISFTPSTNQISTPQSSPVSQPEQKFKPDVSPFDEPVSQPEPPTAMSGGSSSGLTLTGSIF